MPSERDEPAEVRPLKPLFEEVVFAIVPGLNEQDEEDVGHPETPTLAIESHKRQVIKTLTQHGATYRELSSDLENITHIISGTADFPGYSDCLDAWINVVKPSWVTQSVMQGKLANPRAHSPDPVFMMSDVVLSFASDIPQGDKDAIIGGLLAMGGQYSQPLTKAVTHVVALSPDDPICQAILTQNLPMKLVLPHWFDDCLKLGKRIECGPYTLPDPQVLDADSDVQVMSSHDLKGAHFLTPEEFKQPAKDCDVFRGHTFRLDTDLEISNHLRKTVENIIEKGGGRVVGSLKDADILVCQFRAGLNFKNAVRERKEVGNLNWLFYLISYNRWISPLRRLLHYPYPKGGIPGFKDLEICLSNYSGIGRGYLETLVKAAGARFTKSMSAQNTHLITAHGKSQKVEGAREWNVHVVNHLWLEESYAKCRLLSVSNPKYTFLPEKTNLVQILGQTSIDRGVIRDYHIGPEQQTPERIEQVTSSGTPTNQPMRASTGRGAKQRAINNLHKLAPDIALFEKESKRKGGVTHPVRDPDRKVAQEKAGKGKRARTPTNEREETDENEIPNDITPIKNKRPKANASSKMTGPIRVSITGGRDTCDPSKEAKFVALGGILVLDESSLKGGLDVLVANRFLRTTKFLVAIASGAEIVASTWIDYCIRHRGSEFDTHGHELKDAIFEKEHNVNLASSLERSRSFKEEGGLLVGWTIFVTSRNAGPWRQIVEANGGSCRDYTLKSTDVPKDAPRRLAICEKEPDAMDIDDAIIEPKEGDSHRRLFLISDEDLSTSWSKFRSFAKSGGYVPCIVRTEWLLRVALTQSLEQWDDAWEFLERGAKASNSKRRS